MSWIYSILPGWAADVPHWALAAAIAAGVVLGPMIVVGLWRYWAARVASAVARASHAEEDQRRDLHTRMAKLSDRYDDLDHRIDEGFTQLQGVILATEQRHSDRLATALDAIREQQHADHEATRRDVGGLVENVRQDVQRFTASQARHLTEISATQRANVTRLDYLERRAEDHDRRITALAIEQQSIARAISGRATATEHLHNGRSD